MFWPIAAAMMVLMSIADYLENKILDKVFKNTDFSVTTVYVALFTADPGEASGGTEVSGGSYARTAATFATAASGATSNNADIVFPEATGNWGTVTHAACMDASSGGNRLWTGALTASKAVNTGITFRIPTGDLDVTLD